MEWNLQCFFFFFCCTLRLAGSQFFLQGAEPGPWQWKPWILITKPPGKSQTFSFWAGGSSPAPVLRSPTFLPPLINRMSRYPAARKCRHSPQALILHQWPKSFLLWVLSRAREERNIIDKTSYHSYLFIQWEKWFVWAKQKNETLQNWFNHWPQFIWEAKNVPVWFQSYWLASGSDQPLRECLSEKSVPKLSEFGFCHQNWVVPAHSGYLLT